MSRRLSAAEALPDPEALHRLTERQVLALDALLTGATHAEAAELAGVHRVTVTKWASRHPAFVAEMNRRRGERTDAVADAVLDVTLKAVGVARSAVEAGDADAALAWLKLAGVGGFVAAHNAERLHRPATSDAELDRQARAHDDSHSAAAIVLGQEGRRAVERELLADPDMAGDPETA
jgi:hypothetical protein